MHMWSLTAHLPAYHTHWMVLFRRSYTCLSFLEQIILTVPLCSVSDIVANAHVVAFLLIILTSGGLVHMWSTFYLGKGADNH